jgi:hypothetical protein
MNIFILDEDPVRAAQMLCDKHVVKMCLETAQMLSTISGGPYKPTHANHPCTVWAKYSRSNYLWLYYHGMAIAEEYEFRYAKEHKCKAVIHSLFEIPEKIPGIGTGPTPFAQAMPDQYKNTNAVDAYRDYYMSKLAFLEWTKRETPEWFLQRLDKMI